MRYTPREDGNMFDGADIIKVKLRERYMTQKALSDAVGMSQARISELLHGRLRPTKGELSKIATALDIDISQWRAQSKYVSMAFPVAGNSF